MKGNRELHVSCLLAIKQSKVWGLLSLITSAVCKICNCRFALSQIQREFQFPCYEGRLNQPVYPRLFEHMHRPSYSWERHTGHIWYCPWWISLIICPSDTRDRQTDEQIPYWCFTYFLLQCGQWSLYQFCTNFMKFTHNFLSYWQTDKCGS